MQYYSLGDSSNNKHPIAILVTEMDSSLAEREFLFPFGLDKNDVLFVEVYQKAGSKKTPAKDIREYIDQELSVKLKEYGVEHVVVTDSDYFKTMTGQTKSEQNLGSILTYKDSKYPWNIMYSPGYKTIFYNPQVTRSKIAITFNTLTQLYLGQSVSVVKDVINKAYYPSTLNEIKDALDYLAQVEIPLAIDIETFSLKHYEAGIGSIAFSWNTSEGISFVVDPDKHTKNIEVRKLLKEFYIKRKHIRDRYHNISFDSTVLVYQLFMDHSLDTEGLLYGIDILLSEFDCTKIIKYLATNSTAGNELGLKEDNIEFLGQYSVGDDIKDISKLSVMDLLKYNLHDVLATNNTFNKHYPTMVADQQEEIYESLFKSAIRDIVQMQLTGLPVDINRVNEVHTLLLEMQKEHLDKILGNNYIKLYREIQANKWVEERNAALKTKKVTLDDYKDEFNYNSGPQLRGLLYDLIGLPVLEVTKTKQPAIGGEVLKSLVEHTIDPLVKELLENLAELKKIDKILTSFIPNLLNSYRAEDGWNYLFGFFNLGGTVSGRLSSSNPNLQQLPASGPLAKLIKSCFKAPPGWLFVGLDYNSLEDYISALTTKDPNKLKVYSGHIVYKVLIDDKEYLLRDDSDIHFKDGSVYSIGQVFPENSSKPFATINLSRQEADALVPINLRTESFTSITVLGISKTSGYDGHSLRAYTYYKEQMPDINLSVASINSIQTKYKDLRQESKSPTFALTYQGTYLTLMKNCGFTREKAIEIEKRFKLLYKHSIDWIDRKLHQATIDGYITGAFGLRVRTPILAQTVKGTKSTPFEAEAEGRTAGNALGQSWCLLNNRSGSGTMKRVRESVHSLDIKPCAQIHDAQYYLVRDNISALLFLNNVLVEEVQWQEHPDIQHDTVKLSGELGIFYPDWNTEITIPPKSSYEEIESLLIEIKE